MREGVRDLHAFCIHIHAHTQRMQNAHRWVAPLVASRDKWRLRFVSALASWRRFCVWRHNRGFPFPFQSFGQKLSSWVSIKGVFYETYILLITSVVSLAVFRSITIIVAHCRDFIQVLPKIQGRWIKWNTTVTQHFYLRNITIFSWDLKSHYNTPNNVLLHNQMLLLY